MPTKKTASPPEIYQIKVTLLGTRPPIWRRLLVPANLTLEQLHDVLQLAMGWEDCHMHEFRIGQKRFGTPDPDEKLMGLPSTASERTARLFNVLRKVGAKAVYTYDFGDGWEHGIAVEKVLLPEAGHAYPICVDGKRHGPPEDCGGCRASTTFWKRSATRSTTNTRRCAIGWATTLTPTPFRSTRSTASLRPYIADGPRLNPPESPAQVACRVGYARLLKGPSISLLLRGSGRPEALAANAAFLASSASPSRRQDIQAASCQRTTLRTRRPILFCALRRD